MFQAWVNSLSLRLLRQPLVRIDSKLILTFDGPNHDFISAIKFILISEICAIETNPRKMVVAIEYKKARSRKFIQSRRSSDVADSNCYLGSTIVNMDHSI